jgi:hypothetical protein
MHKVLVTIIIIFTFIGNAKASAIPLKCSITVSGFTGIKDQAQFFDVNLKGLKNNPTGAKKLTVINNFEFWVMNHSLQTIGNITRVVNFQVAIKDLTDQTFTHALSNSYVKGLVNHSARISLVEYDENQFFEKGEVMFSCKKDVFD